MARLNVSCLSYTVGKVSRFPSLAFGYPLLGYKIWHATGGVRVDFTDPREQALTLPGVAAGIPLAATPPEFTDAQNSDITPPRLSEAQTNFLEEQYHTLREELQNRGGIRQQVVALTLLVAGSFLSVGIQPIVPITVLMIYPVLALFLAYSWASQDGRIGDIGRFIRDNVEPEFLTKDQLVRLGWENYLTEAYNRSKASNKSKVSRARKRATTQLSAPAPRRQGMGAFGASGVFLTTQVIAILLASIRYYGLLRAHWPIDFAATDWTDLSVLVLYIGYPLLLAADWLVVFFTHPVLKRRRH